MLTPDSLLAIASDAEALYNQLSLQFPAGTIHDGRNDARWRMEQAIVCAQWMELHGHQELAYVGPFGEPPFKRRCRVRIRKGAMVHSMHPRSKGTAPSRTTLVVTAHSIDPGFVDTMGRKAPEEAVRQPRITWAGAGGYWRSVDANDVALVTED